jgi:RNA polymerase sigma-70 factor (ECF subfamily)
MAESDADLIKRAQLRDLDAFCVLAERYARRIHLLASHYSQNLQDAEDLSQEVWLKAYQGLQTFRFDSSFYTW